MATPHSDACFVRAYRAATAEAWMDGPVHAFAFFGGVPQSVLYDNDRCLVSKILANGKVSSQALVRYDSSSVKKTSQWIDFSEERLFGPCRLWPP